MVISLSLSRKALRLAAITSAIVALSSGLLAQAPLSAGTPAASTASGLVTSNATAPSTTAPPANGLNLAVDSANQYDDVAGWSSILTPTLSLRINRFLSFDTSVPYFLSVNADVTKTVKGVLVSTPVTAHGAFGDTGVAAHFELHPGILNYSFTASGSLPSGDTYYNLSANQPTYFMTNHFDMNFGPFNPDMEIGEGNSTSLVGHRARRAYIATGPVAAFQIGTGIDLPFHLNLDFEAYEALPIGNQNVYGRVKNKKGKTVTVLEGSGVAEDNGLNLALDAPINRHLGVSIFYNRSLRQYDNTTGFSLSYVLRGAPKDLTEK